MDRAKFIYLTGLLPILLCVLLVALWILTASLPVGWIAVILSALAGIVSLIGIYHAYAFYTDKTVSKPEYQQRRKFFLGHSLALSLGLAMSFQTFQYLRASVASASATGGLTITVKNTGTETVKHLHFALGTYQQTIDELPGHGEKVFKTVLPMDATLSADFGQKDGPKAQISIGSESRNVLIRIDPQQNILPEVSN